MPVEHAEIPPPLPPQMVDNVCAGIPLLVGGNNGWDLSAVEAWSIYLFFLFVTLFFVFIMVNFFFGFVSDTMANQQSLTADGKMVNEEVSGIIMHEFQVFCPSTSFECERMDQCIVGYQDLFMRADAVYVSHVQTLFLRAPTNDGIADMIEDEFERQGVEYRLPLTVEEEVALINKTADICRAVNTATEEVMDMISYCNDLVKEMETSSRGLCSIAKQLGDTRMQPFRGKDMSRKSRFNASAFAAAASRFTNKKPQPSQFSQSAPISVFSNLRAEPAKNKGRKKAIIDLPALLGALGLFQRRGKTKTRHETLVDTLVAASSDLPHSKQREMWQEIERWNRLRGRFYMLRPGNATSRRLRMGLHKAPVQGPDDATLISQVFIKHLSQAAGPGDRPHRSSIFRSTAPVSGSAPTLPGEPLVGNSNAGAVSEGIEHCWAWPRSNLPSGENPTETSAAGHSNHEDSSIRVEPALPLVRTSFSSDDDDSTIEITEQRSSLQQIYPTATAGSGPLQRRSRV